ncbi:MAG: SDR family oxidoreductase [Zetaproteobacteria bacterium]|nr:MAG: SDR family oxidoreductase [Zetaproteobacteria bacterium]
MSDKFAGSALLIVGATGGIGSALARRLAKSGARLALAARTPETLENLARETGGIAIRMDATQSAEVDAAVARSVGEYGRLDGVAHCVGSVLLKPAHSTTDEEWDQTLLANLSSAFYVLRAAARVMQRTGGSIVLISSAAASTGLANHEAIAAAKGGIAAMSISAAATYASRTIRVNCVAPGLVRTPLTARLTQSENSLKASQAMHPLGRIGDPEDVAAAIAFLLDPANSWITGQVLGVDGGLATLKVSAGRSASANG